MSRSRDKPSIFAALLLAVISTAIAVICFFLIVTAATVVWDHARSMITPEAALVFLVLFTLVGFFIVFLVSQEEPKKDKCP